MKQQAKNWRVRVIGSTVNDYMTWQVALCLPDRDLDIGPEYNDRYRAERLARDIRNAMKQVRQEVQR